MSDLTSKKMNRILVIIFGIFALSMAITISSWKPANENPWIDAAFKPYVEEFLNECKNRKVDESKFHKLDSIIGVDYLLVLTNLGKPISILGRCYKDEKKVKIKKSSLNEFEKKIDSFSRVRALRSGQGTC